MGFITKMKQAGLVRKEQARNKAICEFSDNMIRYIHGIMFGLDAAKDREKYAKKMAEKDPFSPAYATLYRSSLALEKMLRTNLLTLVLIYKSTLPSLQKEYGWDKDAVGTVEAALAVKGETVNDVTKRLDYKHIIPADFLSDCLAFVEKEIAASDVWVNIPQDKIDAAVEQQAKRLYEHFNAPYPALKQAEPAHS